MNDKFTLMLGVKHKVDGDNLITASSLSITASEVLF
jgi:hypothetical protein